MISPRKRASLTWISVNFQSATSESVTEFMSVPQESSTLTMRFSSVVENAGLKSLREHLVEDGRYCPLFMNA
jgi:hypothetical protein